MREVLVNDRRALLSTVRGAAGAAGGGVWRSEGPSSVAVIIVVDIRKIDAVISRLSSGRGVLSSDREIQSTPHINSETQIHIIILFAQARDDYCS